MKKIVITFFIVLLGCVVSPGLYAQEGIITKGLGKILGEKVMGSLDELTVLIGMRETMDEINDAQKAVSQVRESGGWIQQGLAYRRFVRIIDDLACTGVDFSLYVNKYNTGESCVFGVDLNRIALDLDRAYEGLDGAIFGKDMNRSDRWDMMMESMDLIITTNLRMRELTNYLRNKERQQEAHVEISTMFLPTEAIQAALYNRPLDVEGAALNRSGQPSLRKSFDEFNSEASGAQEKINSSVDRTYEYTKEKSHFLVGTTRQIANNLILSILGLGSFFLIWSLVTNGGLAQSKTLLIGVVGGWIFYLIIFLVALPA